jgi:hypothetical protein
MKIIDILKEKFLNKKIIITDYNGHKTTGVLTDIYSSDSLYHDKIKAILDDNSEDDIYLSYDDEIDILNDTNIKKENVEYEPTIENKIEYQFTANPLKLLYILDSDCLKMLNLLIQESSYWEAQGQLIDGYFNKSINELMDDMFMTCERDVRTTIESLYVNDLIDVITQGCVHKANKFKINIEKIKEIDSKSILEVKKFVPKIYKFKRDTNCTYAKNSIL